VRLKKSDCYKITKEGSIMAIPEKEIRDVIKILLEERELKEIEYDDTKKQIHIKVVKQDTPVL